MNILIDIIAFVLQLLVVKEFFKLFVEERKVNTFVEIMIWIAYVAVGLFVKLTDIQILFTAVTSLLIFAYSFKFKIRFSYRIYLNLIMIIILILGEILFGMVIGLIYDVNIMQFQENFLLYIQGVLVTKLLTLALIKILGQYFVFSKFNDNKGYMIIFLILPLSTVLVLLSMTKLGYDAVEESQKLYVLVVALMLIISNIVVFYVYDYIKRVQQEQISLLKDSLQLKYQSQYFKELYQNQEISKKVIHDMKHSFFSIKSMIKTSPEAAIEEIEKTFNIFSRAIAKKITGVESLDSLLCIKEDMAKGMGIDVEINAYTADIHQFEPVDLCVLIGNLFDNSIEACEKIPQDKTRIIALEINEKLNFLVITIRNSILNEASINNLITTKSNKELHGLGIKSIKQIVDKYNGEFNSNIVNNQFVVNMVIEKN